MSIVNENELLLAFVHVEKAAGTSLIHILRKNFFLRYCDVRPLSAASERTLRASDLAGFRRISPGVRCIAGHSLKPWADLAEVSPGIRYITLLRDPIRRYISQYQHWKEKMGKSLSFEEFLDTEEVENFQTKKIAGCEDVDTAKRILDEKFLLVGTVEQFDEFLLMLRKKLYPMEMDVRYNACNKALDKTMGSSLEDSYRERIEQRNQLDIELYRYVCNVIQPKLRHWYGPSLEQDLEVFQESLRGIRPGARLYLDYLLRKLYVQPLSGLVRRMNGLPARGSY